MTNVFNADPIDTTAPGQQARFREEQVEALRKALDAAKAKIEALEKKLESAERELAFRRGEAI